MYQAELELEIWKPIQDFPYYAVSNLGQVKSLRYNRILKQSEPTNRYLQVNLSRNGKSRSKCVHHLVAFTFLGPRPDGYEVNHKNKNFQDNRLSNLEYIPWRDNRQFKTKTQYFCVVCKKPFPPKINHRKRETCSKECYRKHHWTLLICSTCGKVFYRYNSQIKHRTSKRGYRSDRPFCSKRCYGICWGRTHGFVAHPENINSGPITGGWARYWELKREREANSQQPPT